MIRMYYKGEKKKRRDVTKKRLYETLDFINEFGYNDGLERADILAANFDSMMKKFNVKLAKNSVMLPIVGNYEDLDITAKGVCEIFAKHKKFKGVLKELKWSRTKLQSCMKKYGLHVVTKYYYIPRERGEE